MTQQLERIKQHPFYAKWHFEIGIVVLFIGLSLVALGLADVVSRQDAASLELRRHDAEIARQAHQGELAHVALCAQREAIIGALALNRRFLKMTLPERIQEFGSVLGRAPDSLARSNIAGELRTLKSYSALRC